MALNWVNEGWMLHLAESAFGTWGKAQLAVESVGETGWEWHVWDTAHQMRLRCGQAATLDEAKAAAERALVEMAAQLSLAA